MDETKARELLERLLKALSEELPANQPIATLSGEGPFLFDFEIESRPVRLLCNPALKPFGITVSCPLGPVPEEDARADAVLRQLLRACHLAAGSGTRAGYEPADRCLHLLHVEPLVTASARLLVATMSGLVRLARQWQTDHFLADPPAPRTDELAASFRA